jgi:hypothetical protein
MNIYIWEDILIIIKVMSDSQVAYIFLRPKKKKKTLRRELKCKLNLDNLFGSSLKIDLTK